MEYSPVRVSDIIRQINSDIYLPAIQREFVWGTDRIERLFDSIMADFPIGSFLYWRLEQKNKDEWPVYEFIRDLDSESPHNQPANMAGITKDITLVLDGQQRITSLFIGLRGSYRYFYYRWRKTQLYLNLLKAPVPNDDNPEELTYGFAFRESAEPDGNTAQLWYKVGRILDYEDAFAHFLPPIAQRTGRKGTHMLCLLAGAAGLISVRFIQDPNLLMLSMVGVGIAWASTISMPYSILAGAIPEGKTGIYMGIFNFFIVIPEIVAALGFGWVMSNFLNNDRMAAVTAGGISLAIAALLVTRVTDDQERNG